MPFAEAKKKKIKCECLFFCLFSGLCDLINEKKSVLWGKQIAYLIFDSKIYVNKNKRNNFIE